MIILKPQMCAVYIHFGCQGSDIESAFINKIQDFYFKSRTSTTGFKIAEIDI